jgi:hypothetical protein
MAVAIRRMLGERIAAIVATVSGGHGEFAYPAALCIHTKPRIDGFALGAVGYGIAHSQGIRWGGKPELDMIPTPFE